jgi:cytochrome c5
MSQQHHDPAAANTESHPVKMAIAVTVGAFALILGIMMLAHFAIGSHVVGDNVGSASTPEAIAQRIAPVTTLALDPAKGAPVTAAPAAPTKAATPIVVTTAVPAAATAGAATASAGEGVYKTACFACHGAGIAGAPKAGEKAAWAPRIAQGKAALYDHAIHGYQGKAGVMPPKGGNTALTDADVKSAVDYLVSLAK